jgi:hypothetical protein
MIAAMPRSWKKRFIAHLRTDRQSQRSHTLPQGKLR